VRGGDGQVQGSVPLTCAVWTRPKDCRSRALGGAAYSSAMRTGRLEAISDGVLAIAATLQKAMDMSRGLTP